MIMLSSVGVEVGCGVGGFEGTPVVGFCVGCKVGDFDGGPVVGEIVGYKERSNTIDKVRLPTLLHCTKKGPKNTYWACRQLCRIRLFRWLWMCR